MPAGLPLTGAEIGEVDAFFGARGDIVGVASALAPAAWVLATLFGAGAVAALRRSERDRGEAWSLVGFAGLVLQNATFAAVVAIRLALTSSTAAHDGAADTAGLWALHDALFTLNGTFLALALIGLSVAGRRAGLIRPWHGSAGAALGHAAVRFGHPHTPGHRPRAAPRPDRARRMADVGGLDRHVRRRTDPSRPDLANANRPLTGGRSVHSVRSAALP